MTARRRLAPLLHFTTWLLLGLVAVLSLFGTGFWNSANLQNLVVAVSIEGIMVVGMTIVMIGGGFDLSVGSVVALSGVIVVNALGLGMPIAILLAFSAAGLVGLANGLLISWLAVNPFIATLGSMVVVRGLVLTYTDAQPVSGSDLDFMSLGRRLVWGLPLPGLIFVLALILGHVLLAYQRLGREIYALGGNEEAARLAGVNVARVKTAVYMLSGSCAAVAGLLLMARFASGSPQTGEGFELNSIAAAVVGGTSLMGGRGLIVGTFVGALLIGVLNNVMNLLNIESYTQEIVLGAVILLAVVLDELRKRLLVKSR